MENWKLGIMSSMIPQKTSFQWVTRMLLHQMLSHFFPILLFVAHHHIAWFFCMCRICLIAWSAPPCHALATQFPECSSTSKISSRLLNRCPLLAMAGLLTHVLKLGVVVYYTLIGAAGVWISDSISLNNSLLWQKTVDYAGAVVLWLKYLAIESLCFMLRDISPN